MGILPEAMINMIASLGWNDGTTDEIYSLKQLIDKFDLNRVQKSGAHFNEDRLFWLNGHYIRNLSDKQLFDHAASYLPKSSKNFDDEHKLSVLSLVKERLKYFDEIPSLTNFFFEDLPIDPKLITDNKILNKFESSQLVEWLGVCVDKLEDCDFKLSSLVDCLNQLLVETKQEPKVLFSLIRIATTEAPASPPLAETMNLLGKDKSLARISSLVKSLNVA